MKNKKHFSIRKKLLIVFGLLIMLGGVIQGSISWYTFRKAMIRDAEERLTDKAADIAALVESVIDVDFEYLRGVARITDLNDDSLSYPQKSARLQEEFAADSDGAFLNICDLNGNTYYMDGRVVSVADRHWYKTALEGNYFISEPYLSPDTGKIHVVFSLPLYNKDDEISGVICAGLQGLILSEDIKDILIGKTGYCYMLSKDGTIIAHRDNELVSGFINYQKLAENDAELRSVAEFQKKALEEKDPGAGYYTLDGEKYCCLCKNGKKRMDCCYTGSGKRILNFTEYADQCNHNVRYLNTACNNNYCVYYCYKNGRSCEDCRECS